ncbi:ATP-binding protein, partial [Pseudomonas sp. Irchel 3A18]|uniref:ATP-binding protein n=1 Tax=Pseudomonas sp. Irchel 3A18 TaxID=2008905 RepID=UPI001C44BE1B
MQPDSNKTASAIPGAVQGTASTASSKWLLEHLLQQEHADRAVRSVNHQMNMAKLPMHR